MEGYSLHADVAVPAHARERLEHVGRSLLRPPSALERLTESSHGQLLYELPHPRRDGSTHLLLDPRELIEKLSVLIPAPRFCLLRYQGILAPYASSPAQVIPRRGDGVEHARVALGSERWRGRDRLPRAGAIGLGGALVGGLIETRVCPGRSAVSPVWRTTTDRWGVPRRGETPRAARAAPAGRGAGGQAVTGSAVTLARLDLS